MKEERRLEWRKKMERLDRGGRRRWRVNKMENLKKYI